MPDIEKDLFFQHMHVHTSARSDLAFNSTVREREAAHSCWPRLRIREDKLLLRPNVVLKGQYN
jgi:hypothetical protein